MSEEKKDEKETKILEIPNKDPLKDYFFDGLSIEDIISKFKKREKFETFYILSKNNCLMLKKNFEMKDIIFINPIEVCYKLINNENNIIDYDKCVHSTMQIDETINNAVATEAFFYSRELKYSYFENKFLIAKEKNLKIYYANNSYKFVENHNLLNELEENIEKEEFSKYFDKYFKYNIEDNNKTFIYYESDNRIDLEKNFNILANSKHITKFKITGPSNDGKSTTLLYLSRLNLNIVYLNLKVINSLYKDEKIEILLDLLMYEFGRIDFDDEEQKKSFQDEFNKSIEQTPMKILINLINNLITNKVKIILILDQFKGTLYDSIFYDDIKNKLNNLFKVVISYSISDNNDFDHIAKSLQKNKGNPSCLSKDNEDDFFYYSNLFNTFKLKKLGNNIKETNLYNLFNFNPKYIYHLNKSLIGSISNKIKEYFEEHSKKVGINNLHAYLFNYSKSVNKEFHFDDLPNITTKIPMKYTYLIIKNDNSFELRYQFRYIETIIEEKMEFSKVKDYFLENKDKENFFEKKFKGDYFEYLAAETISKKKDKLFNKQIKNDLTVQEILSMERYEDQNSDKMIIENYDNSSGLRTVKKKEYYEEKIKLIDNELKYLNPPVPDINEDKKTINIFKYEEYSKEIELLKRKTKRNLNQIENNKNKINKTSKKGNNYMSNQKDNNEELETVNEITDMHQGEMNLDEKDDLEKEMKIINYKDDLINNGILIKQKNVCGKTLDLAVMLGNSSNKKFIGFQMKYYEKGVHLKNPEEFSKINLKENMKSILIHCFEEFNIKINEWHYFFCMYYNSKEKNSYNKALVNTCNKNDIEYIFFDPINENFYDRDFNLIKGEIKVTYRSNLDCFSSTNPYAIFKNNELLENFAIQRSENSELFFINDLIFNSKKSDIIKKLKEIIGDDFEDICRLTYNLIYPFPTPEIHYLFLFESKMKNSYIYYYNKDNKNYICGELINNILYRAGLISSYINYKGKEEIPFYVLKLKEKKTKN